MRKLCAVLWIVALAGGCEAGTGPTGGASAGGAAPSSQALTIAMRASDDNARRLDRVEQALEARDRRIRELEGALAERDARIEELGKKVEEILSKQTGEMQEAERQIARLSGRDAEVDARLEEMRRILETIGRSSLLPNVVRDVPRIDAKVIAVERGERGALVLLSAGKTQGVEPSFQFTVARAGKPIAMVVVEQVGPEYASAKIVSQKEGEQVREGDAATTRPN